MLNVSPAKNEIFDYENSTIQRLVKTAYADFLKPEEKGLLDKAAFWARLPLRTRLAVIVGNINYQVGNGGFTQWVHNGYSASAEELISFLVKLPKVGPIVAAMMRMAIEFAEGHPNDSFVDYWGFNLDSLYYELESSFLNEVEIVLSTCDSPARRSG